MEAVKIEIVISEGGDLTMFKNGQPVESGYIDRYADSLSCEITDALDKHIFGVQDDFSHV